MLNDNDVEYVIAKGIKDGMEAGEGFYKAEIPAGEYLVFEVLVNQIGDAYGASAAWMQENGYKWPHGVSFELYDSRMRNPEPNQRFLDVYIPIAKA